MLQNDREAAAALGMSSEKNDGIKTRSRRLLEEDVIGRDAGRDQNGSGKRTSVPKRETS